MYALLVLFWFRSHRIVCFESNFVCFFASLTLTQSPPPTPSTPDPFHTQEIRTAQTFAAFPVHYRIHLYVAASFATADKVTKDDIDSRAAMFDMLKSRPDDQRHIIGAFELLCQASPACFD